MEGVAGLLKARRLARVLRGATELALLRSGLELGLFEALRVPQGADALAERLGLAGDLVGRLAARRGRSRPAPRRGRALRAVAPSRAGCSTRPEAAALHAALDQAALSWLPRLGALPELMKGAERPALGLAPRRRAAPPRSRASSRRRALGAARARARRRRARAASSTSAAARARTSRASWLRHRDARGVGVELDPAVAEQARRTLREAQVSRRGEIRAGDFLTARRSAPRASTSRC